MATINIPELVREISTRLRALDRHDAQSLRRLRREYSRRLAAAGPREVVALGQGIDSWGAVDAFAVLLAGPAWREDQIATARIRG